MPRGARIAGWVYFPIHVAVLPLTIGALPTSVSAVTVTHADGGNGTQSEPYYGGADWTKRTTDTQKQSVQKTASFEKDGVQGTVYRAGENGPVRTAASNILRQGTHFLPYILRSTELPRWKALQQPAPKAS